jgi:RHS repeat-associated protein
VTFTASNHQGSLAATLSNTSTTSYLRYRPYGDQRGPGTAPNQRAFLNQVKDTPQSLTYLNQRSVDTQTGTFTTVDPLTVTTRDPYIYANANPISLSDPSGLCSSERACETAIRQCENSGGVWNGLSGTCGSKPGPPKPGSGGPGTNGLEPTPTPTPAPSAPPWEQADCGVVPRPPCPSVPDPCEEACVRPAPPRAPEPPNWTAYGYQFIASGSAATITINSDLCPYLDCDLLVILSPIGGDVLGGGTVNAALWNDQTFGFADISVLGVTGTAIYIPRRALETIDEIDEQVDFVTTNLWPYGDKDTLVDDFEYLYSNQWLYSPPDGDLAVTTAMVGLGGLTKYPGAGSGYVVQIFINLGGPAGDEPIVEASVR